MYGFLCWNLFLAWIPWLAGQTFRAASRRRASTVLQLGWFALWLLFLPNAPYIATDLIHLAPRPPVPLWYDLALLLSYAGTGLLLGYVSLLEVQTAVEERFSRTPSLCPDGSQAAESASPIPPGSRQGSR